jgi:WD40 repeat protein
MPSIAPLDIGDAEASHVELAGFVHDFPVFAIASGLVHLLSDRHHALEMHSGLLAAAIAQDGKSVLTSGEDGKICNIGSEGTSSIVAETRLGWIDQLATGPGGMIGFASGRSGIVIAGDGKQKELSCERSMEGLAFAPKGARLAIARYDGVELVWVNTASPSQFLEWKGAHTGVVFSPDGKYVVSMMQENALHGWRLADNKNMRMSGYPAKVRSLSFSAKGRWLASSGAPAAIVWPFSGKDGPMGKAPKELGAMGNKLVTRVSCHPQEEVVAIGYEDGMILAVRIEDGKEAILKRPGKGQVSALGWDRSGTRLAFGTSEGEAGVINLKD